MTSTKCRCDRSLDGDAMVEGDLEEEIRRSHGIINSAIERFREQYI